MDEQTVSDLGIFNDTGKPSIYSIFNLTVTPGGGIRLENQFRHPLSDEKLINERSSVHTFFSSADFVFPTESETIGILDNYLQNTDIRSQLQVSGQSLNQRFKDMIAPDHNHVFVLDGVTSALQLIHSLVQFIKRLENTVNGSSYEDGFNRLRTIIYGPEFETVRQYANEKYEAKLSLKLLAELDLELRFRNRSQILSLLELLYDLDVLMAVGKAARKNGFHFAKAMPKAYNLLRFDQVYHPQVVNATANDLVLNKEHNILFLTGANMAGKSTLMKSIGIALYLAHMGFPVAAASLEFSVRDGIYTSINLSDNINAGASHYYAEVLRVKEVAVEMSRGGQLFVIFDELFRGTNVKDAYDATIALSRAFSHKSGNQFVISTHIMEAGQQLQEEQLSIKYQFLPTKMHGDTPTYSRVLTEGITADRQGMIIIQNAGILDMLDKGLIKYGRI